jgi:hypothetical protein
VGGLKWVFHEWRAHALKKGKQKQIKLFHSSLRRSRYKWSKGLNLIQCLSRSLHASEKRENNFYRVTN